jgi:dienelactone hydrolase
VQVAPALSLEDQPLAIRVSGLEPGVTVTLTLRSTDASGHAWASHAVFAANARGRVDLGTAVSLGGSYNGVWPLGLLVSMAPTGKDAVPYLWHDARRLAFSLTASVRGRVLARTTFHRSWSRTRLERQSETVASAGFFGTFVSPPGARHRTAVLVLGGSEGGLRTTLLADRFAADGVPALALAYFKEPGLPQTLTNVPLEYFEHALTWLAKQPQVDRARVAVLGVSRGSEAALLLGVHDPRQVHGVIALVPSSVVNCGIEGAGKRSGCIGAAWTLGGKAIPYTQEFNATAPADVPAAVIPVERIRAPLLVACGGGDTVWQSCSFTQAIMDRLRTHGDRERRYSYTYLDAGHSVGSLVPDEPGITQFDEYLPFDEKAREQLWPHVLAFVRGL